MPPGEQYTFLTVDEFRRQVLKIVRGRDDVRRRVGGYRGENDDDHRHHHPKRVVDFSNQRDGIGDGFADQLRGCRGEHHAEAGEQHHGQRQAERSGR
jgi:hypothetical protein